MSATARRKLELASLDDCILWERDDQLDRDWDGRYYLEIKSEWDGIASSKDVVKLIKFLQHCEKKMKGAGQ